MALYGGVELPGRPDLENVRKLDLLSIKPIQRMQRYGFAIDVDHFRQLSSDLTTQIADKHRTIISMIPPDKLTAFVEASGGLDDEVDEGEGGEVNLESGVQMADLLFSVLEIGKGQKLKTTKGGDRLATDKKQLEFLKTEHPIVNEILDYRQLTKLKGTYVDKLPRIARVHPRGADCPVCGLDHKAETVRVHTKLLLTRTATNRVASKDPNLQNISARTALGRRVREGFIASPGTRLCQRDFSQIELRLLAHCSGDENMIRIYKADIDIHLDTACRAFDLPADQIDKLLHRAPCKNVNFGICVAQGQLVLTNEGLVPIEKVTPWQQVWDGVQFVHHDGVKYNGLREVITYDGLTATSDHKVWTTEGKLTLGEAAARRVRLVVTESEGHPLGYVESDLKTDRVGGEGLPGCESEVLGMQGGAHHARPQYSDRQVPELHLCEEVQRSAGLSAGGSISRNGAALYQPERRELSKLRRAWDQVLFQIAGRVHRLCAYLSAAPFLQRSGHWTDRQRWSLPEGEYSVGIPCGESAQSTYESLDQLSGPDGDSCRSARLPEEGLPGVPAYAEHNFQVGNSGGVVEGNPAPEAAWAISKLVPVYDILNAGPRRRFTCSGKLVSNCYGLSEVGLYDQMLLTYSTAGKAVPAWMTQDWCKGFIQQWFGLYPQVKPFMDHELHCALRYGIVWTLFGFVRKVPEVRSVHKRIQSAGMRQAGNVKIQGTATGGLTKLACAAIDERLERLREAGYWAWPLLPVHDEIIIEAEEDAADAVQDLMGEEMDNAMVDRATGRNLCRVPIKSEGHILERWLKD